MMHACMCTSAGCVSLAASDRERLRQDFGSGKKVALQVFGVSRMHARECMAVVVVVRQELQSVREKDV